uniref:RNA helicase n=1 Tax=Syphacia muris TaxID=451379 RepID=A0A158R3Z2_9BILA
MSLLEKSLYFGCSRGTLNLVQLSVSYFHSVKRKQKKSDTFGLIGNFGPGVQLFKPVENDSIWKEVNDVRGNYEVKSNGLRTFEIKQQIVKPTISEPLSWTKAEAKRAKKQEIAKKKFMEDHGVDIENSRILIKCARKEFTHFEGMKYPNLEIPLVSQYWAKSKYKGDWFTIEPLQNVMPLLKTSRNYCWEQVVDIVEDDIVVNAANAGFLKPTEIQVNCLAAFLSDKHLFIASETGSGKTVAYAIPLLSRLLKSKASGEKEKALVLLPTVELLVQTKNVIKTLTGSTGIKMLDEKAIIKNSEENNNGTCDDVLKNWELIVSTPGAARKLLSKSYDKESISTVVIDEADMLLDDSFIDDLSDIFHMVEIRHSSLKPTENVGARVIFSSASCPETLQSLVESLVSPEHLSYIKSRYLHDLLPHVRQKFIRIREVDKNDELLKMLTNTKYSGQILIFCQDKLRRNMVAEFLNTNGINTVVIGERNRQKVFDEVRTCKTGVIVATDVAARGLDFPNLTLIINYDFPAHVVEYIHRVGRVGRLSSKFKGRVISFICRASEVEVVNSIELAARFSKPIRDVETNVSAEFQKRQSVRSKHKINSENV